MGKWFIKGIGKFVFVGAVITWVLMGVLGHSTGIRTALSTLDGFAGAVGAFVGIAPSGGDAFRAGKAEADRIAGHHRAGSAPTAPAAPRPTLTPRTSRPGQPHPVTTVRH
jgi:hypothetical protein